MSRTTSAAPSRTTRRRGTRSLSRFRVEACHLRSEPLAGLAVLRPERLPETDPGGDLEAIVAAAPDGRRGDRNLVRPEARLLEFSKGMIGLRAGPEQAHNCVWHLLLLQT